MRKEDIISTIREDLVSMQQSYGVRKIGLFGSYAKDRQTKESDIDILVEMPPDYKSFMKVLLHLEKKLNNKVDIIRVGPHLSQKFLHTIQSEVIYA